MRKTCSEANSQLQRWNSIRSEWEDNKSREIEADYIDPIQSVLTYMDEKLCEINGFIDDTEEKINEIKEENSYG
jgi:hypothetical protein